jgi:hypothetical protein
MAPLPNSAPLVLSLHPWQHVLRDRAAAVSLVIAHRRAGKTTGALNEMRYRAKEHGVYLYVAPSYRVARCLALYAVKQFAEAGAHLVLAGADDARALASDHWDGVVLDEADAMAPSVWDVLARVMSLGAFVIAIGSLAETPGLLSELCDTPDSKLAGDVHRDTVSADVSGIIEPALLDSIRNTASPQHFRREFLCQR